MKTATLHHRSMQSSLLLAACGGVLDSVEHRVAEHRAHRHRPRQRHRHEGEVHAVDPAQATERLDRLQMSMSAEGKEERGPVWRSGDGEEMGGMARAGIRGEMRQILNGNTGGGRHTGGRTC